MLYRKQTYQSVHNGNYMTIRYNPLITLAIKPTALISNDFHFYLARNWNFLRLSAVCLSMFVVHLYPIRPHSKESCYRSLDWPCFNYDTVRINMLNIKPLAFIIVCLGCVMDVVMNVMDSRRIALQLLATFHLWHNFILA